MNLKLLTAAAVLTATIAAPALAQDPVARSTARHQQDVTRVYHRDHGFWPADVAAGVIGGAISTAGAIATAPFRNDAYAYDNGYYGRRYYNNGFACEPGTTFRGEDGLRHICQ